MDFNGNDPGQLNGDIDLNTICSTTGTFENLNVGVCGNIKYKLSTEAPVGQQILVSTENYIEVGSPPNNNKFSFALNPPGLAPLIEITPGTYYIEDLLQEIQTKCNQYLAAIPSAATVAFSLDGGKVRAVMTGGNYVMLAITGFLNYKLGQRISLNGNDKTFTEAPDYLPHSGTEWRTYNFNQDGDVFESNLTVNGDLAVAGTIISDLNVEDAVIRNNHGAIDDTFTSGYISLNTGDTKVSGMLRDKDDKEFYLFNNVDVGLSSPLLSAPAANGDLNVRYLTASELRSPDTLTKVDLTNSHIRLTQNGVIRVEADLSGTRQHSANQLSYTNLTNTTYNVNVNSVTREVITPDYTNIKSPDGTNYISVADAAGITGYFNNIGRTYLDGVSTYLGSPNEFVSVDVGNTGVTLTAGTAPGGNPLSQFQIQPQSCYLVVDNGYRLSADSTTTTISGVDPNDKIIIDANSITQYINNVVRAAITSTSSQFFSPNATSDIDISNTQVKLTKDGVTRHNITNASSSVYSPDGQTVISILNGGALLASAGSNRLFIDINGSNIIAPNGDAKLIIKNDGFTVKRSALAIQSMGLGNFAQTNTVTVTGTVAETQLSGSGVGSLVFGANAFLVGDSFSIKVSGVLSAAVNKTWRLKVKSGATILIDTGIITMQAATAKAYEIEIYTTVRTLGLPGVASIYSSGNFNYTRDIQNEWRGGNFIYENTATFDTTVSNTLTVTIEHDDIATSTDSRIFIMNQVY